MQDNRVVPFVDQTVDCRMTMTQSLRPILTWMRIIGIELDQLGLNMCSSALRRAFFLCFGVSMLLINVMANYPSLSTIHNQWSNQSHSTVISSWNMAFNYFQSSWANICIHCSMLVVAISRWRPLWKCFDRMQTSMHLTNAFHNQLRRVTITGTALIITEIFYDSLSLWLCEWKTVAAFSQFAYAAGITSQVYPISAVVLFLCLGWMASMILQALIRDIQSYPAELFLSIDVSTHFQLVMKWKQNHVLVCEFIQHVNQCFGAVLLIFIAKQFVCIINYAMIIILVFQTRTSMSIGNVLFMIATIKHLFYLYMVTYVSEEIRKQAHTIAKELRKLQFSDQWIQYQVNFFMLEVQHSSPTITAMGFFEVDLDLYPAIIGTTVTYLIILCQFQTAETNGL